MLVMPSDCGQSIVHYWAGKGYPVGWLYSLGRTRVPKFWLPYAIDNGCFGASLNGCWDEEGFLDTLEYFASQEERPRFAVVPDVVGDAEKTFRSWEKWHPRLSHDFDFPWAFVVQDGMIPSDVPKEAEIVFVGGSLDWKWRTAKIWSENFDRVHIGAVNTLHYLKYCKKLGVESVDGTGWFRKPQKIDELHRWFRCWAGEESFPEQLELKV